MVSVTETPVAPSPHLPGQRQTVATAGADVHAWENERAVKGHWVGSVKSDECYS